MAPGTDVEKHLVHIKNKIRTAREYLRKGKISMAQKNLDSLRVYIELRMPSEVALITAYFQYYIVHNIPESLKEAKRYLGRKKCLMPGYAHYIAGRCQEQKNREPEGIEK